MQNDNLLLTQLPDSPFDIPGISGKMDISALFKERNYSYLNEFTLFLAHFKSIPNLILEVDINCKKANKWFFENYKSEIKDFYFCKRHFNRSRKSEFEDVFYFLYEDLIVNFETKESMVRFLYRKTNSSKVEGVISAIRKFKNRHNRKPEIYLIVTNTDRIETRSLQITKPKMSIEDNYNDDFKETHETILKRLLRKNDKGIVLLHGKSGTGKTSYIRYLIASLKKDIIFLPPNMARIITNPDFISILIDNPNSVLVIEDAENLVVDREKDGSSPVSTILNISDGLLADCLNIQVICTFNTDISKIDNALIRKGRLIAKYEFTELETIKAQQLSDKLGFKTTIDKPMTLTSIYNQNEKDFHQSVKNTQIGFKSQNNMHPVNIEVY